MRKSVWLLSFALTAFVITMLAGVIYAYHGISFTEPLSAQSVQAAPLVAQQSDPTQEQAASPVPVQQPMNISPTQAASVAAKSLNRTDLYSVQMAAINGLSLYKVTFVSGDIVYVSMDGQVVLTVPALQATATIVPTITTDTSGGVGGGGHHHHGGGGGGGGGGDDDGGGD